MKDNQLKPLAVAVAMVLGSGVVHADSYADAVVSSTNAVNTANALGAPDTINADISDPGDLVLGFTDNVCITEGGVAVDLSMEGTFPIVYQTVEGFSDLEVGTDIFWFNQMGLTADGADFSLDAAKCDISGDILTTAAFEGAIGVRKDKQKKVKFNGIAHNIIDGGEGYSVGTVDVEYSDGVECNFQPASVANVAPGIGIPLQTQTSETEGSSFLLVWEYNCTDGGEGFANILLLSKDPQGLEAAENQFDLNLDFSGKGQSKWRGGLCLNSFSHSDGGEGDHRDVDGLGGLCNPDGGEGFADAPEENTGLVSWGNITLNGDSF